MSMLHVYFEILMMDFRQYYLICLCVFIRICRCWGFVTNFVGTSTGTSIEGEEEAGWDQVGDGVEKQ